MARYLVVGLGTSKTSPRASHESQRNGKSQELQLGRMEKEGIYTIYKYHNIRWIFLLKFIYFSSSWSSWITRNLGWQTYSEKWIRITTVWYPETISSTASWILVSLFIFLIYIIIHKLTRVFRQNSTHPNWRWAQWPICSTEIIQVWSIGKSSSQLCVPTGWTVVPRPTPTRSTTKSNGSSWCAHVDRNSACSKSAKENIE